MKTITALLIGGSLALAGAVMAQETTPQESPAKKGGKGQKAEQTETTRGGGGNATGNAPANTRSNRNAAASTETGTPSTETGGAKQRGGGKHAKTEMGASATGTESATGAGANTNVNATTETGGKKGKRGRNAAAETSVEAGASVSPGGNQPMETGGKRGKGRNATVNTGAEAGASVTPGASMPMDQGGKKGRKAARAAAAATSASAAPSASVGTNATNATSTTNAATSATPGTSATVGAAAATTNTTTATSGNPPAATLTKEQGTVGRGGKKVEVQQLQQIKQQHASFRAQPRPDRVPSVTFSQNYRISGAERWQGPQYEVYRSYHPEWHDQNFYRSRYQRVELIGGGYYYWNNGYWYPAWGYDPGNSYYAYDAPIYVGHRAEPPDKVIADVQAELQQMGYYTGEVDGLLGPLTRQALRDYQAEHGLMVTEVIDEPTLDALQLS